MSIAPLQVQHTTHRPVILDDIHPRQKVRARDVARQIVEEIDDDRAHQRPVDNPLRHNRVARELPLPENEDNKQDAANAEHGDQGRVLEALGRGGGEREGDEEHGEDGADEAEAEAVDEAPVVEGEVQLGR